MWGRRLVSQSCSGETGHFEGSIQSHPGNVQTHSMQYGLSQCSSCWIYTAVSVWTTKLARLSRRKPAAIMYFFRVAWAASYSGLLLRMVGRRVWCNMGRPSASPFPRLDCERRPWRSSLSNGCCDRPSVGRCNGGRLTTMSSSESWEERPGSGVEDARGSPSSILSATMSFFFCRARSLWISIHASCALREVVVYPDRLCSAR